MFLKIYIHESDTASPAGGLAYRPSARRSFTEIPNLRYVYYLFFIEQQTAASNTERRTASSSKQGF
ncbi:hypothetical protein STRDD11_02356 [Streptococcus sp. DD11]|nr:hypothetical protein STRDD11_02356 [Streptococcus sp. DD11]